MVVTRKESFSTMAESVKFVKEVLRAKKQGQVIALQAPTGTGKSIDFCLEMMQDCCLLSLQNRRVGAVSSRTSSSHLARHVPLLVVVATHTSLRRGSATAARTRRVCARCARNGVMCPGGRPAGISWWSMFISFS